MGGLTLKELGRWLSLPNFVIFQYMKELNKIYNEDCLVGMRDILDKSVDCIICDLPYGSTSIPWDVVIPFDKLWEQYERIIKDDGNIILFCSGLFTIDLINSNRNRFRYKLIWNKNVPTGMATAKYRPMKYYEEICVFGNSSSKYNPIMKPRVGVGKACYNYDHYCSDNNHIQLKKNRKKDMIQIMSNHPMCYHLMWYQIEMESFIPHRNRSSL